MVYSCQLSIWEAEVRRLQVEASLFYMARPWKESMCVSGVGLKQGSQVIGLHSQKGWVLCPGLWSPDNKLSSKAQACAGRAEQRVPQLTGWGFTSRHLCGSSQLSVTPVPRVLIPFFGLHGHCTHVVHIYTHRQNTRIHKMK